MAAHRDENWVPLSIRGNEVAERWYRNTQAAWEAVIMERDELRSLLKRAEWCAEPGEMAGGGACPWCMRLEGHGHLADCRLAAALRGE